MKINLHRSRGKNFCYAPWTNIHIDTTGCYKSCCAGEAVGDARISKFSDLISSKKILEIKKSLYYDQEHSNCKICKKQEEFSSNSERSWYNDISNNENILIDDISNMHIQNLDIRWSNTCNLSCTYCGSFASSQWAIITGAHQPRLDYSDTISNIVEFIDSNKKTIKNLALLGGEPLLQRENEMLLNVIDQKVNINIITNLSVPLEKNKIFKKLLEKENVMWDISFETVEDRFDYVRRGSNWALMVKNIKLLQDAVRDKPGHFVGITSQYCVYNAMNLVELHEYFIDHKLPTMRWNQLFDPSVLAVTNLPTRYLNKAIYQLEQSIKFHPGQITDTQLSSDPLDHPNGKFLSNLAATLKKIQSCNQDCDYLYQWHQTQEQNWSDSNLKFSNLWKEYCD